MTNDTKNARGRPSAGRHNPPRIFGRVDKQRWQVMKIAARIEGKSFTQWALGILLPRALDVITKRGGADDSDGAGDF